MNVTRVLNLLGFTYTCFNCGDLEVICNLRHFRDDFIYPALLGAVIGGSIGAIAALIQNAMGVLG